MDRRRATRLAVTILRQLAIGILAIVAAMTVLNIGCRAVALYLLNQSPN